MSELSPIHWLLVIAIIVILFGGKRIPEAMRGICGSIRSFREGMRGDIRDGTATRTSLSGTTPAVSSPREKK